VSLTTEITVFSDIDDRIHVLTGGRVIQKRIHTRDSHEMRLNTLMSKIVSIQM